MLAAENRADPILNPLNLLLKNEAHAASNPEDEANDFEGAREGQGAHGVEDY